MKSTTLSAAATASSNIPSPRGWPLLRLGFRPFYLGAATFGALAIPFWLALFLGQVEVDLAVAPLLWHAHEMLFGFAVAVIVGFLLTAGKAWTGQATPRGAFLGALASLWLAARIAAVTGPYALYAALDLLLLPVVTAVLVDVLVRARSHRNLPLAGILLLLSLANLSFHLAVIGAIATPPMHALHAALALIVMIECVITGRVIPAFTNNVTPGLKLAARPALERATLAVTALALLAWVVAGTINTIVGSGTLVTFPTLLMVGLPPITANMSNNMGLIPGSITGTLGYRAEMVGAAKDLRRIVPAAFIGGLIGALLVLVLDPAWFRSVVPVLIGADADGKQASKHRHGRFPGADRGVCGCGGRPAAARAAFSAPPSGRSRSWG